MSVFEAEAEVVRSAPGEPQGEVPEGLSASLDMAE